MQIKTLGSLRRHLGAARRTVFLFAFLLSSVAFGMGGKLQKYESQHHSSNWQVKTPKVVIAFGMLDSGLIQRYKRFSKDTLEKYLKRVNPLLRLEVIEKAQSQDVVQVLADKSTVGFIFISHTYKAKNIDAAISIAADGHPLPPDILSAATPSLRFSSFLGCHGPEIMKEYGVAYEYKRLSGSHIFYYNRDELLSANFMFIDNLKKLLKKEIKDLARFDPRYFMSGQIPHEDENGKLTIRVKDVYPGIEPRFVYLNGRIVGMLGTEKGNSNQSLNYEEFTFEVPAYALETKKEGQHHVKILSSEISPGALADNYLIESVTLEAPFGKLEKHYSPSWHIGDADAPPSIADFKVELHGSKKEQKKQLLDHIRKYMVQLEWMDRNPEVWAASPLNGRRIFSDVLQ